MKVAFISFNTRKIVSCAILIVTLLAAFSLTPVLAQTEGSTVQSYENINVDTAYSMMTNGSFPNLVILDVRYQYEYDMGHLSGAILIPYNELEMRLGELEEHRNHEIIVYCRSGYRSQIACEILVKYNFTKVYNMLGGILAWIEAGYPIWTTSHYVTVNIVDEEILLQIEPLLLHQTGCIPCAQNQTCPSSGEPTNITFTVLEQEENYTKILLTYEVNGTSFDIIIAKTLLHTYKEVADEANRTINFIFTEITTYNSSVEFYSLSYVIRHIRYNLTLYTTLSSPNSETYNSSFTIMNCALAGNLEVASLEFVEFNSSVTLSQLYAVLGKVAKEIGKVYEKSGDESLTPLAQAYYDMNKEAKYLSKLVEKQLTQYDHEILRCSAVLIDGPTGPPLLNGGGGGSPPSTCTFECWMTKFNECFLQQIPFDALQCMWTCMWSSLPCVMIGGPQGYAICLSACFAVCQTQITIELILCAISAMFACGCL